MDKVARDRNHCTAKRSFQVVSVFRYSSLSRYCFSVCDELVRWWWWGRWKIVELFSKKEKKKQPKMITKWCVCRRVMGGGGIVILFGGLRQWAAGKWMRCEWGSGEANYHTSVVDLANDVLIEPIFGCFRWHVNPSKPTIISSLTITISIQPTQAHPILIEFQLINK